MPRNESKYKISTETNESSFVISLREGFNNKKKKLWKGGRPPPHTENSITFNIFLSKHSLKDITFLLPFCTDYVKDDKSSKGEVFLQQYLLPQSGQGRTELYKLEWYYYLKKQQHTTLPPPMSKEKRTKGCQQQK